MNTIKEIFGSHWKYRSQIIKLAQADLKKTYKGAALGWAWAFVKPAVYISVFWFAFTLGLRSGKPVDGYPYFLWLLAGVIPWFYMNDMITGGASSLRRYTYLVTKIKFPVCTIPTFIAMSKFVVHLGLMVVVVALFMVFGYYPDIYLLQLPIYMLLMFLFFSCWGLFAGMLSAMSRDFLNLVKSMTTALFWLSGILYDVNRMGETLKSIMLFNPVTLLVNGYRNVFIYKQWIWETPEECRNLLIVIAIMFVLACWSYKKLRNDIGDVL